MSRRFIPAGRMARVALALLLLAPMAQLLAQAKVPFSAERSWQLQRIAAPTLSPDGSTVIAPVTRYDVDKDEALTDLWLWSRDGRIERRFTASGKDQAPLISPDGKWLAFTSRRGDDKAQQLYVMPMDGGEARRLTAVATGVHSVKWFGDSRRLAFVSRVFADLALDEQGKRLDERREGKMTARVWDQGSISAWDQYLDEREQHVFAVAIDNTADNAGIRALTLPLKRPLPRNAVQGAAHLYDVAPDGRELAFVSNSSERSNQSNSDLFSVALDAAGAPTGTPRNLTADNPAGDSSPLYSPDGRWLAFVQQRVRGFYADRGRLMLRDRRGGDSRELFPDWDRSAAGLVWAADSQRLYGAIDDAGTVRAHEFPLQGGTPRPITGEGSFGQLAVARDGTLVGLRQSFVEPPTLVRIDPRNGQAQKLSRINDALLAGTDMGRYESVTYTGADGVPIQMWVNYPPGFDRSRKYPLFLLIHGGPHSAITDGMSFRWNAQVFSSWGYVTAWPNFHGSSGFGQAFTDSINPEWAEKPWQDVIKAAEWFAAQPWIDSSRMVAGGASYGGYLTSVVLGRPHPFNALINHAGVYNLYTQYAADFSAETPRFGGFWESGNDEVMRRNSPHYAAGNFNTPTLVIHGQNDLRVPVNHGIELYHTLHNRGVPTRFVYFPNENHWILKPQNSIFWYGEVKRWIEQYNVPKRN
ncbi:prolyl oligopeptidase family serine peptidase [Luteimonas sp. e5]